MKIDEVAEALNTVMDYARKFEMIENNIIKTTNDLKMASLNLSIENTRIKEPTGIKPIIDKISGSINMMNNDIKNILIESKEPVSHAFSILQAYIDKQKSDGIDLPNTLVYNDNRKQVK